MMRFFLFMIFVFSAKTWSQVNSDYDILSKQKKIYIRTDFALNVDLQNYPDQNYAAISVDVRQDLDAAASVINSLKPRYPSYQFSYAPIYPVLADSDGYYVELELIDGTILKMPFRTAETSWEDSQMFPITPSTLKAVKNAIARHQAYVSIKQAPFTRRRFQESTIQVVSSSCQFVDPKKNQGIFSVFKKFSEIWDNSGSAKGFGQAEEQYVFEKFFQSCVTYEEKVPVRSFSDLIDNSKNSFLLNKRSFELSETKVKSQDVPYAPKFKIKFN